MKYSVTHTVFIVENYTRNKSYKKCQEIWKLASWSFNSIQNKCPQKSLLLEHSFETGL